MKGLIIGDPLRGQLILANGNCCLKGLTLMTLHLFAPLLIQSKILIPDHPYPGFFALIGMRDIVGPFLDIEEVPTGFLRVFQSGIDINSFVEFLSDFVVQLEQNPDITLTYPSQSPSTDSSMHFNIDDITLGAEIAFEQILMPTTTAPATDLSERFSQLHASISQMSIKQMRTQSGIGGGQVEPAATGFVKSAGEIDRRRRFQSQVTVDEAVVSYYSQSCRQLPFILLLTNLLAVAILITVDEFVDSRYSRRLLMSNVEQEADISKPKQLTIYESWMSTAERNSNGENDKTQSTLKMERING
ncbi:hypothetical protein F511_32377 [Dorcoceras hygrometricum]|uniref:Uncharacterized protein n=1 Tax=Dorcoceras hygrometricum TaxID=472368 RepID=A0A2Z7DDI7_9LAMI|nr:hypothetical protein F511_32377 [Dorcoceras hygrometricum]